MRICTFLCSVKFAKSYHLLSKIRNIGINSYECGSFDLLKEMNSLATTRIIPMHQSAGCSLAQSLFERIEYGRNPIKTGNREYISTYACDQRSADAEFLLSKKRYEQITGRSEQSNIIAYQIRQSFKPGEVTPEEANQIGYDFATRFLKGKHTFILPLYFIKILFINIICNKAADESCVKGSQGRSPDKNFRNYASACFSSVHGAWRSAASASRLGSAYPHICRKIQIIRTRLL